MRYEFKVQYLEDQIIYAEKYGILKNNYNFATNSTHFKLISFDIQ